MNTRNIGTIHITVPCTVTYGHAPAQAQAAPSAAQQRPATPTVRRHTEIVYDLDTDRVAKPQRRLVPTMMGNDVFFLPEPEPIDYAPLQRFLSWLFG